MRTRVFAVTSTVMFTGLVAAGPGSAADWNGSYAADGACFCSGTLPSSVATALVPTPIGAQSVASVCEHIGDGPELTFSDGRFNHVVFPDAQCGHGPFAGDGLAPDTECAGTREPGTSDCELAGPRWDLALAFGENTASGERAVSLAAAQPTTTGRSSTDTVATVSINGQEWREAPPGTEAIGGSAGSRIILDGKVYLKADDPLFSRAPARPATVAKAPKPVETAARASTTPRVVTKEPETQLSLVERQKLLVAEARERARQRREARLAARADQIEELAPEPQVPVVTRSQDTYELNEPDAESLIVENESIAAPSVSYEEAVAVVTDSVAADDSEAGNAFLSAFRLPADARGSSHDFSYVQAMPLSFDIGGAGVAFEGSAEFQNRFHLLARGATANAYSEFLLGAGYHYTHPAADRMTFMLSAGIEYGVFPLSNGVVEVDDADTGLWLGAGSRLVVNSKFELEAGLGYSSFHEGDPTVFGGAFYHINRQVDLLSRFELGDNDSLGIGLRVYY